MRRRQLSRSLPLRLALPALPLLAVALGGATNRPSQGAILLALGALLLWRPPARSPGWTLDGVAAALVALAVLPLALPARWFPGAAWRAVLADDLGVALPGTLSPQPWLTVEGIVLLLAGLGWLWWTLDAGESLSGRERRGAARVFVLGAVALALVSLVCYRRGVLPPGWQPQRGFGPFPNRNQTANFLALGGLLALGCAHADLRAGGWARHARALGWLLGLAALGNAIFVNFSRAGVLILLGGAGVYGAASLWQGRGGGTARLPARAAVAVSALAVLLAGFLVFGGVTLERFLPGPGGNGAVGAVTGDFRWRVQADALRLARAVPWCGLGLGNFGAVFPFYRDQSAITSSRAVHPESDWLWMWTEMGWPSAALALFGAGCLARKLRGRRALPATSKATGTTVPVESGGGGAVRLAATVGLLAFFAHGFVEVSTHRLGTMLTAGFLAALALPSPVAGAASGVGRDPRRALAFRLLGASLAGVGALWCWSARAGGSWPPGTLAAVNLDAAAQRAARAGDFEGATARLTEAMRSTPLSWRLYLSRAVAAVRGNHPEAAEADFRRTRELEPLLGSVPEVEAAAWRGEGQHPDLALAALEELFRRDPERGERVFRDTVQNPGDNLEFRRGLETLAWREPTLWLALLEELGPEAARPRLAFLVANDPALTRFAADPARLRRALRLWAAKGDAAALVETMEAHPDWQTTAWRAWAEALARSGDPEGACRVAARFVRAPTLPASLSAAAASPGPSPAASAQAAREAAVSAETLAGAFARAPGNLVLGLRLLGAQRAAGRTADALVTLVQLSARPGAPAYLAFLEAGQRGMVGDWPRAWEAWGRYLRATGEGE